MITRAAHVEIRVTNLDSARDFYVDVLGMLEIDSDSKRLYLGGLEETDKYSLVLREAESAGLGHMSFRVVWEGSDDPLVKIGELCNERGLRIIEVGANTLEKGQGFALRIQDPDGFPLEFFHTIEQRPSQLRNYDHYRGANILRLDHFNVQIPDVEKSLRWWMKTLGFRMSEYMVEKKPDGERKIWGVWLHRKQNVHDIALMTGRGPRFHHVGMWVPNELSVIRTCDILAARGMAKSIERGPGRHGLSNAFFVYLRDPDGNRIELFTGDYLIPDSDHRPLEWDRKNPQAGTWWGHQAPQSWFKKAALVEDIVTGKFVPTQDPTLEARPLCMT